MCRAATELHRTLANLVFPNYGNVATMMLQVPVDMISLATEEL